MKMNRFLLSIFVSGLLFSSSFVCAHEPIFSLGPETIFKGGFGIETEIEYEKGDTERETAMHYEIIYGITEKTSLTVAVPHIIVKKEDGEISDGLGEITIRAKSQLFRKDTLGAQEKISFMCGLKFPTGNKDKTPALGSGSWDGVCGLSLGHESTTLYGFITGRYRIRNLFKDKSLNREKGDQVLIDLAFGFRPWMRPYKSWDLVVLLENSYIFLNKDEVNGVKQAHSGGEEILMGPTFFWSIRNVMIKGGIQFSVRHSLRKEEEKTSARSVIAVEYHF